MGCARVSPAFSATVSKYSGQAPAFGFWRAEERVQLEPRRTADGAHRLSPLREGEDRFHFHRVAARVGTAGTGTGRRAEGVVVGMGWQAQKAKPLHHQRFGPADAQPLPGFGEAVGQGQPVHPQLLDVAMKPAFRQGAAQDVDHGQERVAVHHT